MKRQFLKKNLPTRLVLSKILDIPKAVAWTQEHLPEFGFNDSIIKRTVAELESLEQGKRELLAIEFLSKAMALTKRKLTQKSSKISDR